MTSTGADGPYWAALRQGELRLPRCAGCGVTHWPAVFRCASCGSWEHDWTPAELSGEIYTWARTHHKFGGAEAFETPFTSVVVALDAGPRLMGVLEPGDGDVAIGRRVHGKIVTRDIMGVALPTLRWSLA